MDAYRRGDELVVSFDLPGMAPGTIDLTVEQNVLTIKAERRFDGREGDEVIAAERLHGAFTRQLFLGDTLDAERLVASYETGVLTLRIPVAESAKPRKVQITEGADGRTIEAQTTATDTDFPYAAERELDEGPSTVSGLLNLRRDAGDGIDTSSRRGAAVGAFAGDRLADGPSKHAGSCRPWLRCTRTSSAAGSAHTALPSKRASRDVAGATR
jgi:HSP20 family protein